jgi:hypothetical protein
MRMVKPGTAIEATSKFVCLYIYEAVVNNL